MIRVKARAFLGVLAAMTVWGLSRITLGGVDTQTGLDYHENGQEVLTI